MSVDDIKNALIELFPKGKVSPFFPYIEETFDYADIKTENRVAMFLSQIGVESKYFTVFEENLSYKTPERLVKIWPSKFRMPKDSEAGVEFFEKGKRNPYFYLKQPVKLANFVYADSDLGNRRQEKYGDGWRFRGRGPKQLTGADNYMRFTKSMKGILGKDYIKNPDDLLLPEDGLYAACWFWKNKNLNIDADKQDVVSATKKVTGSATLLKERQELYRKSISILS